jgi:signal transduction histidine kinase
MSRRTLRGKLATLIAVTSLLSMLVFSGVVYLGIYLEEETDLDIVEADDDATRFLLLTFGMAAPISLALTLGGALWLARRWIRPIEEVIRAGGAMSVERLGERLALPPGDDELRDMVRTLNDLFARLEAGFQGLHSFAADVSHEMRTPLAIAISELEVALRRPRSHEEWSEATGSVLRSLRRLVELVEALLELARGGIAGPREPVDLTELAEEVVGMYGSRSQAAGITLVHTSVGQVSARANRAALSTALGAVVANGLRYTPRGGRVEVRVEPGAVLEVDDSGPGVPAAEREAIFAPLRRGAAASDGDEAGLGLGLAIVRRVMEQHGGRVEVGESPLGGARFTLHVPSS